MPPETQYAKTPDGLYVAYQVLGDGPFDLLVAPPWMSHIEVWWESPTSAKFFEMLSSFSRLILYDRRGTGLSDRLPPNAAFEDSMDDITAVLDAVGSERAALFGMAEGGPLCVLFAATYPERTSALSLYGTFARISRAPDYPWGFGPERIEQVIETYDRKWGREPVGLRRLAPSLADDERYRRWILKAQRYAVSPGAAIAWFMLLAEADVREVLPMIRVPTLVLHRRGDRMFPVEVGRYLAEHIPGAKYVELDGIDHVWNADSESIVLEVEEFLTGSRRITQPDRVLATVLFTDIVGSTDHAIRLGDRKWTEVLNEHDDIVALAMDQHRGRKVNPTGDGLLATFDGPARAVRCAQAICSGVRNLGIEVRAGLHAGEVEVRGDDIGGIAVHIGQRVSALAQPGEVLVSRTVVDLVAGSGLAFADRGAHTLKGVPGDFQVYAVER